MTGLSLINRELEAWAKTQAHKPGLQCRPNLRPLMGLQSQVRHYCVPAVYGQWFGRKRFWPVIGSLHEDRKIFNFEPWHYHIDVRFLGRRFVHARRVGSHSGLVRVQSSPLSIVAAANTNGLHRPVLRRFRCHRAASDFAEFRERAVRVLPKLVEAHPQATKNSEGHWVCPHKKYVLRNEVPCADGYLTCPLHGLRICTKTGATA